MSCNITLREVAEFQKGFAFKSKDYTSKGVKIIKVSNLTDDSVDISQCVCVENDIADKYKDKYNLKTNDIVITTVGSWPTNPASVVGKVIRVPKYADNTLLNQNAVRLRSNSLINQNYMYYLLKDKSFKEYIIGTAQGSANQASITQEDIKNFEFILPSLEEQEKIAKILSSLDDKIELNNEMNKTLEEMAQSIFKRWFVDFEFPNEDGMPYKSSGGEMVESELGMIPKGWEVKTIEEISTTVSKGTTPTKKDMDSAEDENNINFIKVKDIDDYGEICLDNLEKIPESVHNGKLKRSILYEKDILFSIAGTIGRVTAIDKTLNNSNMNQAIAFIRLKDCRNMFNFIFYLLKSEKTQNDIKSNIVQAVQANVSLGVLKAIKFVQPSKEILDKYNNIAMNIYDKQQNIRYENNDLKIIRDNLLPKLMSGEIILDKKIIIY